MWPDGTWGPGGTEGWPATPPAHGTAICVPLAPNAPLPVGRRPVRFLAASIFIAGSERAREAQVPSLIAQVLVAMWISQMPEFAAPILAPPILDIYGGPSTLETVGPGGARWPLPPHPDLARELVGGVSAG